MKRHIFVKYVIKFYNILANYLNNRHCFTHQHGNKVFLNEKHSVSYGETKCFTTKDYVETLFLVGQDDTSKGYRHYDVIMQLYDV